MKKPPSFWYHFGQFLCVIPIAVILYCLQITFISHDNFRYTNQANLEVLEALETPCKQLMYEIAHLQRELYNVKIELEEIRSWKSDVDQNFDAKLNAALDSFYSDQIGIFDYASEYAGGCIISTPGTASYPSKFGFRLFGTFDLTIDSKPSLLLQPTSFPGQCYTFYGSKGRIRIGLGRPVVVTHISLEYIRIGGDLSSAPKDFQILGIGGNTEEHLGYFFYDLNDSIIQTFRVDSINYTFQAVELRIHSNYGNHEFTCVYRFRVHSLNLGLK